ncbi:MAG: hypothetical protein AB2822_02720, partial [Candidatus Thiodiazotropha endolucinida]
TQFSAGIHNGGGVYAHTIACSIQSELYWLQINMSLSCLSALPDIFLVIFQGLTDGEVNPLNQ